MNYQGRLDIKDSQKRVTRRKAMQQKNLPIINILREDIHNHETITTLFSLIHKMKRGHKSYMSYRANFNQIRGITLTQNISKLEYYL